MSIILENVSYIYEEDTAYRKQALNNVNLTIEKGEFIGVVGHTGSGKSTLIQHLNGLEKPTSGRVIFNGTDIHQKNYPMKELRSKVGLSFQYAEHQLFEETVIKDVCFGPKNLGLSREEAREKAVMALRHVGVSEDCFEKSPFDLSGGQKKRVAIAGVLAMEPDYLILDEPTAGLDPIGRDEILNQIKFLQNERKIAVILVSHSMEDIAKYVDRMIVMNHGEKVYDDIPRIVFGHYTELEKMGLAAPEVTYIMHDLRERGIPIPKDIINIDEARDAIVRAFSEKGQGVL